MRIPHITIHTNKQAECVEFYKKYAGLEVVREIPGIIFMGNGTEGETLVELIQDENSYEGSGISIGFACKDVHVQHDIIAAAGLEVTPMITPNPFVKFFFTKDPSGVSVQFIAG